MAFHTFELTMNLSKEDRDLYYDTLEHLYNAKSGAKSGKKKKSIQYFALSKYGINLSYLITNKKEALFILYM